MMRKILRNINVLNLLLLTAIILMIQYLLFPTLNKSVQISLPASKQAAEEAGEEKGKVQFLNPQDYTVISDQNPFHPLRTIAIPVEAKPEPKPEFILYGTMITGDADLAFLEDKKTPQGSQGRGKRQQTVHIGDNVSGYIVSAITHEKVVMAKGEDRIEVYVTDPSRKRAVSEEPPAGAADKKGSRIVQPPAKTAEPSERARSRFSPRTPQPGDPSRVIRTIPGSEGTKSQPQVQPPANKK